MSTDPKRIEYNRLDRDYSAWYDGEYIGSFDSYHDAEIELDRLMLDLLERGLVHARPAEPAAELIPSLPVDSPTVLIARSPDCSAGLAMPTDRQATTAPTATTDPAPIALPSPACANPLPVELGDAATFAASALWSLIRMTLDEWREFPHPTPWDAQLAALDRAVERPQTYLCQLCGATHPTWNCPQIGDTRQQLALGEDVWCRYTTERTAFIETVRGADPALRLEWAEALHSYFLATLGKSGGVSLFLKDWEDLTKKTALAP